MNEDQIFTTVIAGLSILFVMGSAIIGLVWRNGKRYGAMATDIKTIASKANEVAQSLDQHIQWHMRVTRGGR